MKRSSLVRKCLYTVVCICLGLPLRAQRYEVVNYNLNSTPVNGIKIKTMIPFINGGSMPTVHIEGYFYGQAAPIGLNIVWYVYNNTFIDDKISSWGAITPPVYLSNESGYIVIFIDDKPYFPRFKVSVYAQGMSQEIASSFTGWSVVDEALGGTNQTLVPYQNQFAGTISVQGKLGISQTVPTEALDVSNGNVLVEKTNGTKGEYRLTTRGVNSWNLRSDATSGNPHFQILNNETPDLDINASSGNVGIGKVSVNGSVYKLDVNGNVRANKLVVNTTGADYVFDSAYRLPSLVEVSSYIKAHHHLPELQAATEMQTNGVDVEKIQTKLLQKVEELTLYIIQQEGRIKMLDARIDQIKSDQGQIPRPLENSNKVNP